MTTPSTTSSPALPNAVPPVLVRGPSAFRIDPSSLAHMQGLVLHDLDEPGHEVVLPDVALDPAWDFETSRHHLREHGHAWRPGESTTIHLAHAQADLTRAVSTLDVHDALRVMGLPGLRASKERLAQALTLDLPRLTPVTPMGLGERMAAQETLVALFLAGGASPTVAGWEASVVHGNPRLFARLVASLHAPLNAGRAYGLLLHLAGRNVWDSGAGILDHLLAVGAPLNPVSVAADATPPKPALVAACETGNRPRALDLLQHGADPNLRRPDGGTALRSAFKHDDPELVMALLNAGANLHGWVPFKNCSVLEEAVMRGAPASLGRIVAEGIDPMQPSPGQPDGDPDYANRVHGPALLDRLRGMRNGRFPGHLSPSVDSSELSDDAQQGLVLLEAQAMRTSLDDATTIQERSSRRRL